MTRPTKAKHTEWEVGRWRLRRSPQSETLLHRLEADIPMLGIGLSDNVI